MRAKDGSTPAPKVVTLLLGVAALMSFQYGRAISPSASREQAVAARNWRRRPRASTAPEGKSFRPATSARSGTAHQPRPDEISIAAATSAMRTKRSVFPRATMRNIGGEQVSAVITATRAGVG